MNWIHVEDDLPANAKTVLVAYNGMWKPARQRHWAVLMARYSGGQWRFLDKRTKSRKPERVRYWMPIPRVPSEEVTKMDAMRVRRLRGDYGLTGSGSHRP